MKSSFLILAAGMGKRMHSSLPKVLIPILGRPMIFHILDRLATLSKGARVGVIVGHQKEKVIEAVMAEFGEDLQLEFIEQAEQLGTGHAVQCAMNSRWGEQAVQNKEEILVLPGDLPLVSSAMIEESKMPLKRGSVMRLLTARLDRPFGYGRIVRRGKKGPVQKIVEEKDALPREKLIQEVAVSIYLFQAQFLKNGVSQLKNKNAQKEYYLTDLVAIANAKKRVIETFQWDEPHDLRGVNNPLELSEAQEILRKRIVSGHALSGVRFVSLDSVWIEPCVKIAPDVTVYPGVILEGKTEIGASTLLGPNVMIRHSKIGSQVEVKAGTVIESSKVEDLVKLGPYAHLRPESEVGSDSKIGNFVELKKTKIGSNTSIAHLSYLGDATVGSRVNIGCGFVTCNFDGRVIDGKRKHETLIEDDVFVGSDCQTVAPVTLKKGAYVASGSTITETVESDDLAIARARQVNKSGYAKKLRSLK